MYPVAKEESEKLIIEQIFIVSVPTNYTCDT